MAESVAEAKKTIKAGDVVLHKPSGQQWVVWGVDTAGARLLNMGWPSELHDLKDFDLAESRGGLTPDERARRAQHFGRSFDDDREQERLDNERMDREWAL